MTTNKGACCCRNHIKTVLLLLIVLPNPAFSLDYFWVGGSGNWSELAHWATTSGGNIIHDQIPTAADHVIFDSSSFVNNNNLVVLDLDNIFSNNLDFRGLTKNLVLRGPEQTVINIFGSIYMHPDVTLDFGGSFDFRGDSDDSEISFKGQDPFQFRFLSEGTWTITDDVSIDSLVHMSFGHLIIDTISISCHRFEVFSTNGVNIDFGDSKMLIRGNRHLLLPAYQWRESLHFDGPVTTTVGSSQISLTGNRASIGFSNTDRVNLGQITLGRPGGKHLIWANWQGQFNFKKLHLRGDTRLEGGFIMQDFELDGGNIYTFQSNLEQRIGQFKTNTDCEMFAFFRSSEGGRPVTFSAQAGNQSITHSMVKDIHVQGATFEVLEANDLGGNQGWNFTEKGAQLFYWIGGTGLWNDTDHWSFSSGGPPSGCLPTAIDDVIFDQASFSAANQSVIINVPSAFCHTMDWRNLNQMVQLRHLAGRPNLSLHIFGSLYQSMLLDNSFDGDIHFESSHGGNEIFSANNEYVKNTYFGSALGSWTLLDKFDVNDTLYFDAGELVTNDQEVECFDFYSESNSPRQLTLGKSIFRIVPSTLHPGYGSSFRINASNFTIDPGTSTLLAEHHVYMYFFHSGAIDFYRVIFQGFGGVNVSEPTTTFKNAFFHHDGDFRGELNVDTLTFSPAKAYWMFMNSQINVDSMSAHGSCDGSIFIAGYPKSITGTISKSSGHLEVTNTMLEGIVGEGGATFTASASQDLGHNQGWTFMDAQPRQLYWVGGDGVWFDRSHWSLTSGGLGGECVPTAIDDVFFDENSFSGSFQSVGLTGSNGPICHNLTWRNAPESTGLYDGVINITGSLDLQSNLSFYPWNTTFRSDSLTNEINAGNNPLQWVEIMGPGQWTFTNDIHIPFQINLWQGTLITNDFDLRTGHLHMGNYPIDFKRKLVLGNSHIIFEPQSIWNEQLFINSNQFTIDPGHSLAEFIGDYSGIRHYGTATLNLHNVYFSSIQGQSRIEEYDQANFQFNKLEFNNNGLILNTNEMDTLLLAAGKLYQLENNKTQTVHQHLRAIGNNCTPIGLESTEPGERSTIFSREATVIGDFIQMRDQLARGGTRFSAGAHSTDISNNSGWIFEEDPDFIEVGFLGPDRTLCQDSVLEFSAFNFSPQEEYLWNTGQTVPELSVASAGLYWAEVTFQDNCVIRDSIEVWSPLSIQVDLGVDSALCEGESLELLGDVGFPGATYRWHDQSDQTNFTVTKPGVFSLSVEADGCQFSDSIEINYHPLPEVEIRGLQEVCEGDTLLLNASLANASLVWQDQTTEDFIAVMEDGTYHVQAELNNCFASDTVQVDFFPVPSLDLGGDTTLCSGEQLELDIAGDNLTYLWQDGNPSDRYAISQPGIYWAEVKQAHCANRDSILVDFKPLPMLPQFRDSMLCEGTSWQINLQEPGAEYEWNTGHRSGQISITQSGDYRVGASLNGCDDERTFNVSFEPPPLVDLGADRILCEGEVINFSLPDPAVRYTWQDGTEASSYIVRQSGTYAVTASKLNCMRRDTVEALFHPIPRFSLGSTKYLCPSDSFTLAPNQIMGQLTWFDGSQQPEYRDIRPGIYWLEMEANDCRFRDSVQVIHQEVPNIDLGADTTLCHDQTLKLNAQHSWVQRYQWQDGSTNPTFEVTEPGQYSVLVTDDLCETEYSVNVQFRQCAYFSIFLPNAFSPNGDNINDTYRPYLDPHSEIEDYLFEIYSRWGQRLFSTTDPEAGWNGRFEGTIFTPESFVARVKVQYVDDAGSGQFEDVGTVMLLR